MTQKNACTVGHAHILRLRSFISHSAFLDSVSLKKLNKHKKCVECQGYCLLKFLHE